MQNIYKIKFILGLSNWGKTTCIQKLLCSTGSVRATYNNKYKVFNISYKKAMVLQFSNCDLGLVKHWDGVAQLCVYDICRRLEHMHRFDKVVLADSRGCGDIVW